MKHAEPDTAPATTRPERELLSAILAQAVRDLSPQMRPHIREAAGRFWRGEHGDLAWICTMLDLDTGRVQRHILAQYPEVQQPRQLELGLEVSG